MRSIVYDDFSLGHTIVDCVEGIMVCQNMKKEAQEALEIVDKISKDKYDRVDKLIELGKKEEYSGADYLLAKAISKRMKYLREKWGEFDMRQTLVIACKNCLNYKYWKETVPRT